jgi:phosphatidylglycerophosphatase A
MTWDKAIGTVFGAGLSPIAPGTCGSLVALPFAIGLAFTPLWVQIAVFVFVTAIGVWASNVYEARSDTRDPQEVVVDEFAGILLTFIGVQISVGTVILGFFLFRLFDITKPQPIRWLDKNLPGGWGIMFDDVAAGIFARIVLGAVVIGLSA